MADREEAAAEVEAEAEAAPSAAQAAAADLDAEVVRLEAALASDAAPDGGAWAEGSPLAEARLRELLGGTLRFHAREAKPGWWRRFERLATPAEELADDQNVLAFLRRTEREPYKESPRKRRQVFEYEFDAAQECTLAPGATVVVRADGDGDKAPRSRHAPLGGRAARPRPRRGVRGAASQ